MHHLLLFSIARCFLPPSKPSISVTYCFHWETLFLYTLPPPSHINCKGNQTESSSGTINVYVAWTGWGSGRWWRRMGGWQAMRSMSAWYGQTVGNRGCGDVGSLKEPYWCEKMFPSQRFVLMRLGKIYPLIKMYYMQYILLL